VAGPGTCRFRTSSVMATVDTPSLNVSSRPLSIPVFSLPIPVERSAEAYDSRRSVIAGSRRAWRSAPARLGDLVVAVVTAGGSAPW
jgi:hypothetical protein